MIGFRRLVASMNRRLRKRDAPALTVDDPDLRVVARTRDPAESATSVLENATALDRERPAVLRHRLVVPAGCENGASEALEADGWQVRVESPGPQQEPGAAVVGGTPGVTLLAHRVQHLSAVVCARENARMVSLAQRLGGRASGWEALQPASAT